MTAAEFRDHLAAQGCYQREFARYVGANERTVRRWAEGTQDIPKWVAVMLDLMERLQAVEAQVGSPLPLRRRRASRTPGSGAVALEVEE